MRSVVYLRVSTDEQAASGLGLEAQLHTCGAWAGREGREVVGPFQDDASGASSLDKRPGLMEAVAELAAGDVLVVAKRDRLGRDPMVIAMIEAAVIRKGCRIVSAAGEGTDNDDPTSVLMRRMVDAFAEYERLIIKARTKAALAAKRRRGERTGQVPIGHRLGDDGRTLHPDPGEVALVAEAKALRLAGMSLRAIAGEFDARGYPPKNGRARWPHTTVRNLINRPGA